MRGLDDRDHGKSEAVALQGLPVMQDESGWCDGSLAVAWIVFGEDPAGGA